MLLLHTLQSNAVDSDFNTGDCAACWWRVRSNEMGKSGSTESPRYTCLYVHLFAAHHYDWDGRNSLEALPRQPADCCLWLYGRAVHLELRGYPDGSGEQGFT